MFLQYTNITTCDDVFNEPVWMNAKTKLLCCNEMGTQNQAEFFFSFLK